MSLMIGTIWFIINDVLFARSCLQREKSLRLKTRWGDAISTKWGKWHSFTTQQWRFWVLRSTSHKIHQAVFNIQTRQRSDTTDPGHQEVVDLLLTAPQPMQPSPQPSMLQTGTDHWGSGVKAVAIWLCLEFTSVRIQTSPDNQWIKGCFFVKFYRKTRLESALSCGMSLISIHVHFQI